MRAILISGVAILLLLAGLAGAAGTSPETIVFVRYVGDTPRLYAMDDSGRAQRAAGPRGWAQGPVWSPDGGRIAYQGNDGSGCCQLRMLAATAVKAVTLAPKGPQSTTYSYESPSWSPDGRHIAFSLVGGLDSHNLSYSIAVVQPGKKRYTKLTSGPADYSFAWSPRSDTLVFTRSGGIRTVGVTGGSSTLVAAAQRLSGVDWSRKNVIAFADSSGVELVRPNGSGRRTLAALGRANAPRWSPDGNTLVFEIRSDDGDPLELHAVRADGEDLRVLTPPRLHACCATWSPDSKRIAFEADGDIWLLKVDGSGLWRLTRDKAFEESPAWRPR